TVLHPALLPTTLARACTLFPYTTLFRSFNGFVGGAEIADMNLIHHGVFQCRVRGRVQVVPSRRLVAGGQIHHLRVLAVARQAQRSEEHTSELQSRENLVCRLLLEKKKYA